MGALLVSCGLICMIFVPSTPNEDINTQNQSGAFVQRGLKARIRMPFLFGLSRIGRWWRDFLCLFRLAQLYSAWFCVLWVHFCFHADLSAWCLTPNEHTNTQNLSGALSVDAKSYNPYTILVWVLEGRVVGEGNLCCSYGTKVVLGSSFNISTTRLEF